MLLEGLTSWNIDTWDIGHYRHRNDPHGCRYTCPSKSGCIAQGRLDSQDGGHEEENLLGLCPGDAPVDLLP
jgi:hypothetical protein